MTSTSRHVSGRRWRRAAAASAVGAALFVAPFTRAQSSAPATGPTTTPLNGPIDLSRGKTLYTVGYAHLDTQWRWAYPQVIRRFLANTLHDNFPLIDKYPDYIFNFTGARRYQFMKEFYPADYERVKAYIKAGRWFPGGSNVDESDQNTPSAESVVRHVLYGNHFFKQEFGICGEDFMVPDCFGFPASLPSILAHCSIKGFHTQKLPWGSAVGIPFNVGNWVGIDGQSVIAALNPTAYTSTIDDDLSQDPSWIARVDQDGRQTGGDYFDYRYYGTGDRGGAPPERSIQNMEASVHGKGPVRVVSATSDQMFRDITPQQRAKLPTYQGELLLTKHSSGSINSQGYMKRWNRKNELLADAAERASVAANWLGAAPYPTEKLYNAWMLLLECQMHDILPGDCLPKCYEYSWNDEVLALNSFAAAEQDGVGGAAAGLNTQGTGVPLVIYNPLAIERTDTFEATVHFPTAAPAGVTVTGPDGTVVPSQILAKVGTDDLKVLVLAKVPSVSFTAFEVTPAADTPAAATPVDSELKVSPSSLENRRYQVSVNPAGDVEQVLDKVNNRRLLSASLRLGFLHENPTDYPAWNMEWEDRQKDCQQYVGGPARVRVLENGPVRVALEITRETRGSTFVQQIRLCSGAASNHVEFPTCIDWRSTECSLEAVMPLAVANPLARYDVAVGTIQRPNNNPKKYEVPQQQWLDLTNPDNSYGVSVLNDCKYGSDKPNDSTVRLTLLYTPGVRGGYQDESSQDFGKHDMTFALVGHGGDWRAGHTQDAAAELNQPLVAFQTTPHAGIVGKCFSLLSTDNPAVAVQAVKKAEDSDEIIVRVKETSEATVDGAHLTFAAPVVSAREVDGQEASIGPATIDNGKLRIDLQPYHLRAYAIRLAAPARAVPSTRSAPVQLPFDTDVISSETRLSDGSFGQNGRSYPAEQWPRQLMSEGIAFELGSAVDGQKNAVACQGQTIPLPAGARRIYLLAAADGDQLADFKVGARTARLTVQDWGTLIGEWDHRLWKGHVSELTYNWANRLDGLLPGFIKRDSVAWHADHQHDPQQGNAIYDYCYLFKYGLDVPDGATTLTLPNNPKLMVFAVTAAFDPHDGLTPAQPLYDTLSDHVADAAPTVAVEGLTGSDAAPYRDTLRIHLEHPLYYQDGRLHYTLDGSSPTLDSPAYTDPLPLSAPTTVQACEFDSTGHAGPVISRRFDINDTTPPTVLSADGVGPLRQVHIAFSEPVTKTSAEAIGNYRFNPAISVKSAVLAPSGDAVDLGVADPSAAEDYQLLISGVLDGSPAANVIRPATVAVNLARPMVTVPVYVSAPNADSAATTAPADHPGVERPVADLPTQGNAPWTINCFVHTAADPDDSVLIAGFGRDDDQVDGAGRYLCKFPDGIRFWSRNHDVQSSASLDTNQWQMLSATYDGRTITLFKNGEIIGRSEQTLKDDEGMIRLAPLEPWSKRRRFHGEIRNFSVYRVPLSSRALQMLWTAQQTD